MNKNQILKENYQNWLVQKQKLTISTAKDYTSAISSISRHYSKHRSKIDLFLLDNISKLEEVIKLYSEGEYSEFARKGSGSRLASLHQFIIYISEIKDSGGYIHHVPQIWLYSPGEKAKHWEAFYNKGIMAINSEGLGDLLKYSSSDERIQAYQKLDHEGLYKTKPDDLKDSTGRIKDRTLKSWDSYNEFILNDIQKGDLIIVKKGKSTCIGYGYVLSDYKLDTTPIKDKEYEIFDSCREVEWHKIDPWNNAGFSLVQGFLEISSRPEYYDFIDSFMSKYINTNATLDNYMRVIMTSPNIILYGPPGTGKTYSVVEKTLKILNVWKDEYKTEKGRKEAVEVFNNFQKQGQIEFVTFHQSYSYEEFIEGIKPEKDDSGISYPVKDGVFKRIALKAQGTDFSSFDEAIEKLKKECDEAEGKSVVIQANSSRFTITYRGGITFRVKPAKSARPDQDYPASIENIKKLYFAEATRKEVYNPTYVTGILEKLYEYGLQRLNTKSKSNSNLNYVIVIDEINRGNISKIFGELITLIEDDKRIKGDNETFITLPYSGDIFGVPQNLYIIGTMNTADRSIALMDTALRRRFAFEEMMPDYGVIDFEVEGIKIKPMLEKINGRITQLYDRDHQIGHAYFIPLKKNSSKKLLCEIFLNRIIPLLQEYFYDDWEKIQMILGDHREQNKSDEHKFIVSKEVRDTELFDFSYLDEESFSYSINDKLKDKEISCDAFIRIYEK